MKAADQIVPEAIIHPLDAQTDSQRQTRRAKPTR
jgi:hypothetical protein